MKVGSDVLFSKSDMDVLVDIIVDILAHAHTDVDNGDDDKNLFSGWAFRAKAKRVHTNNEEFKVSALWRQLTDEKVPWKVSQETVTVTKQPWAYGGCLNAQTFTDPIYSNQTIIN